MSFKSIVSKIKRQPSIKKSKIVLVGESNLVDSETWTNHVSIRNMTKEKKHKNKVKTAAKKLLAKILPSKKTTQKCTEMKTFDQAEEEYASSEYSQTIYENSDYEETESITSSVTIYESSDLEFQVQPLNLTKRDSTNLKADSPCKLNKPRTETKNSSSVPGSLPYWVQSNLTRLQSYDLRPKNTKFNPLVFPSLKLLKFKVFIDFENSTEVIIPEGISFDSFKRYVAETCGHEFGNKCRIFYHLPAFSPRCDNESIPANYSKDTIIYDHETLENSIRIDSEIEWDILSCAFRDEEIHMTIHYYDFI
ncbi:5092_t:CDS:1 [Acaulospora morrowiae]|uniref:5092_t:CDS:1 n=1 Tax=Acaulospora morrowiae TaxID=94023 RepID=A0A9N8VGY7_9GLOM|nr:5092_t:CDS:1 [Acaulospora morrowiae]